MRWRASSAGEATELRFKSLVRPEQMPFDNIAKRHFDSGDYPEALRRAVEAIGLTRCASASSAASPTARRSASALPCTPSRPGTAPASMPPGASRWCRASSSAMPASRPTAGWSCGSARTATARAWRRRCRRWRTRSWACRTSASAWSTATPRETPYSTGTWGSRCMIMSGGAVRRRLRRAGRSRAAASAPSCCRPAREDVRIVAGEVVRPVGAHRRRRRRAHLVSPAAGLCPPDVDPGRARGHGRLQGQSATPARSAMRRTRPSLPSIPRLAESRSSTTSIVEDGGVLVNPMIVDGQIIGGTGAGHRHRALRGDALRRLRAAARLDAVGLPAAGPTEMPEVRILHMETPSPYTRFGQKGLGEGGAIAPPAAITNAVNDALKTLGGGAADVADHATARR